MSEIDRVGEAMCAILAEYKRAGELKGPFSSAWAGESVTRGELKELSDEVWGHAPDRLKRMETEAIQVAAAALRFIVDCCGEQP